MPPELIWHHGDRMDQWWAAVKESRKNPNAGPPDIELPTTENELAKEYH